MAIFGGASRKGVWHPEPHMQIVTVFGGAELDFRQAVLPGQEVTVHATTVLGGLEIVVPPEMRVIDNGVAILGGREVAGDSPESAAEGAPVLRIEGTCVLGGVEVKRKRRKQPGGPGIRGLRDQIRQQRHEAHRMVHEQRHQVRDQVRQQRRELRQGGPATTTSRAPDRVRRPGAAPRGAGPGRPAPRSGPATPAACAR